MSLLHKKVSLVQIRTSYLGTAQQGKQLSRTFLWDKGTFFGASYTTFFGFNTTFMVIICCTALADEPIEIGRRAVKHILAIQNDPSLRLGIQKYLHEQKQ